MLKMLILFRTQYGSLLIHISVHGQFHIMNVTIFVNASSTAKIANAQICLNQNTQKILVFFLHYGHNKKLSAVCGCMLPTVNCNGQAV